MICDWDRDRDRVIGQIAASATLKIACKVRDEPLLTEAWIEHHARIVGYGNLILADNMSSDPEMIRILEKFASRVTIFRFDGPHNAIHWHPRFRPLFQAIRENSRFFSFIDIDERLVHIEDDRFTAGPELVTRLESLRGDEIIACSWLVNELNSTRRFCVSSARNDAYLANNLRWGKPILPSSLAGAQDGIHNAQFGDFTFSRAAGTGFFLLHLTEFPERRLSTNRFKLISRGIVDDTATLDQILDSDFSALADQSFMPLVDQIRRMKRFLEEPQSAQEFYTGRNFVELSADGSLIFDDSAGRETLHAFVADGATLIDKSFNAALPHDQALAETVYDRAMATLGAGNQTAAEALLTYGMQAFPHLRHRYDGPAFRKELLRLYVLTGDWARARRLIPDGSDEFSAHWHCILFARAHAMAGHDDEAQYWWNEVLRHEPDNGEAQDAVTNARATVAAPTDTDSVFDDLADVRDLMKHAATQPHWFMTKYFQHAGVTIDEDSHRLLAMADKAEAIVREWRNPAPSTIPAGARIPRILHRIWLTNPASPSEPLEDYITALLHDAALLRQSGWRVCFWLQDEELIPRTVSRLKAANGTVEICRIDDHIRRGDWRSLYDAFVSDRKFPFAADVLRMVILHQYGGFYGDLGVRIRQPDIANRIAEDFDYSFIFWETMFFQNSFMAMAPASPLSEIFIKLLNDPYLIPPSLIEPVTALSEGQAFSGLMATAILLSIWTPEIRVFPFAPNRRLLAWSSQQSWYKKDEKYGNTFVPDSEPTFYTRAGLTERRMDTAQVSLGLGPRKGQGST
ncbi:tetratricopeptide repeat protein [Rhizobium sp.]